jgi:hypothetical protein
MPKPSDLPLMDSDDPREEYVVGVRDGLKVGDKWDDNFVVSKVSGSEIHIEPVGPRAITSRITFWLGIILPIAWWWLL